MTSSKGKCKTPFSELVSNFEGRSLYISRLIAQSSARNNLDDHHNLETIFSNLVTQWRLIMFKTRDTTLSHALTDFLNDCASNTTKAFSLLEIHLKPSSNSTILLLLKKLMMRLVYMFEELCSVFPNGVPISEEYHFVRQETGIWWDTVFGKKYSVSWNGFLQAFTGEFGITDSHMHQPLRDTFSFASEDYVSVYALDIFSRLFPPWKNCFKVWKKLIYEHPAFMPWSTFSDAHNLLVEFINKPGTFVFRLSCNNIGFWSVGYVGEDEKPVQIVCRSHYLADYLEETKHRKLCIFPRGLDSNQNPDLSEIVNQTQMCIVSPTDNRNSESVLSCGICMEFEKTVQLEPCKHHLCLKCSIKWIPTVKGCPFCRQTVLATTSVQLYLNNTKNSSPNDFIISGLSFKRGLPASRKCSLPLRLPKDNGEGSSTAKRKGLTLALPSSFSENSSSVSINPACTKLDRTESQVDHLSELHSQNLNLSGAQCESSSLLAQAEKSEADNNDVGCTNFEDYPIEEVNRALRVAKGNVEIANAILQEYCLKIIKK
ncbi:unnamed protein product [Trichobilharzia szidati]|nr:unnamed protein product [Trichobilharzia szidati]